MFTFTLCNAFGWLAQIILICEMVKNRLLLHRKRVDFILGHLTGNDNIEHLKIKHFVLNIYIVSHNPRTKHWSGQWELCTSLCQYIDVVPQQKGKSESTMILKWNYTPAKLFPLNLIFFAHFCLLEDKIALFRVTALFIQENNFPMLIRYITKIHFYMNSYWFFN